MIEESKINMFTTDRSSVDKAEESRVLPAAENEKPKQNAPSLEELQACLDTCEVKVTPKTEPLRIIRCNPEIEEILADLSADIPYADWILVAAAIKNEGGSWEMFNRWSQTAPNRYEEDAAKKTWESMGGPEHPEITLGTLRFLQRQYNVKVIPAPAEFLPRPETEEEMQKQRADFLNALFLPNESIEVCLPLQTDPSAPSRPGYRGDVKNVLQNISSKELLNGAWVVINPIQFQMNATATDDTVTAYRYVLVESDDKSIDEQWKGMASLPVLPPVVSVVWSGGKSLHYIIRVDAANKEEYKERVILFLNQT